MNFKKNSILTAAVLLAVAVLCIGWADTFEGIRSAAGRVQSLQSDFVQTKEMTILARPLVAKGRIYFRKPGSLRWEYHSPVESVLLMHNGSSHRYIRNPEGEFEPDPGNLQAMDFVMQEISQWMDGRFDTNGAFNAELGPDGRIVLTPAGEALTAFIQRIELAMADQPGILKEVVIVESDRSLTRLTFLDPRLNLPLDDTVFQKVQ
ncbi:MAG: outer membrane lipoprotein carrier protein LolA [Desulfobacterales bacterium]